MVGSPVDILTCDPSGVAITPTPSIIVVLPIEKFTQAPVTAKLALPTNVTDPVDSFILEPVTLTSVRVKTDLQNKAAKGVPPKYYNIIPETGYVVVPCLHLRIISSFKPGRKT